MSLHRVRVLLFVLAALVTPAAWASPKLEVEKRVIDCGVQLKYREASCSFTLRNAGDSPLDVSIGKSSCACTSEMLSDGALAPGESADLVLTHKPRTDGQLRSGNHSFSVELSTNEPDGAPMALTAKMVLVDQVYADPAAVNLSEAGETARFSVICLDDDGIPEVVSVEALDSGVAVKKVGRSHIGKKTLHEYEVSLLASAGGGEMFVIMVKTISARVPALEVPVRAVRPPAIAASPQRVLFGVVKAGGVVEKRVTLKALQTDAAAKSLSCSDEAVSAAISNGPGPGEWLLDVRFAAPRVTEVETLRADVTVRDNEGRYGVTVPVLATVAP